MMTEINALDACRTLGITLDALYRLIYAAKLPARKVDGRWLIPSEAVEVRLKAREARRERPRQ